MTVSTEVYTTLRIETDDKALVQELLKRVRFDTEEFVTSRIECDLGEVHDALPPMEDCIPGSIEARLITLICDGLELPADRLEVIYTGEDEDGDDPDEDNENDD